MKLIILDRDGVINHDSDKYIKSIEEWIPITGSIHAISRLYKAGWHIAIATNQSGLARGYFSKDTLNQIHLYLNSLIKKQGAELSFIYYCPHLPSDNCSCRKPKPGLLNNIMNHYNVNPKDVWFVGDSHTDIQAAINASCKPALVKTGKGLRTLKKDLPLNLPVYENLSDFADHILDSENSK